MEQLLERPHFETKPQTKLFTTTLVGSFRFMDLFNQTIDRLEEVNVEVLSPGKGKVIGEDRGFKLLDTDSHLPPMDAEAGFLNSLLRSDFGYIINPGGYVGATSVTEIVLAKLMKVPLISMEPIDMELDSSSFEWRRLCGLIPVCPFDKLIDKIQNPVDKIHQLPWENYRSNKPVPNLEELSLRVLTADWIKYRGLGEVVTKTRDFYKILELCT